MIRAYGPADAEALSRLYQRSVNALATRDYSPAQVRVWAALAPSPERLDVLASDGRWRFVAVDAADEPVAFLDLEADGHIHFLYAAPEVAGSGLVSTLYDHAERTASACGVRRLYAEASEPARRFFLKKGFVVTERRDFEVSGVPIHNYAVEKVLT